MVGQLGHRGGRAGLTRSLASDRYLVGMSMMHTATALLGLLWMDDTLLCICVCVRMTAVGLQCMAGRSAGNTGSRSVVTYIV